MLQAPKSQRKPGLQAVVPGYTLREPVAVLSTSVAYLGTDAAGTYLVRVLDPACCQHEAAREAFFDEQRLAARIGHPSMPQILRSGEGQGGRPFLVQPFPEGPTLLGLTANGPLGVQDALDFLDQGLDALRAMHEAGVVHGALTPHSWFFAWDGVLRVVDLAVAASDRSPGLLPQAFPFPIFRAPELEAPRASASPASDLYALAACVVYALTKDACRPRARTELVGELEAVGVSRDVAHVIGTALVLEPACRYPQAVDMHTQLSQAIHGSKRKPGARQQVVTGERVRKDAVPSRKSSSAS